MPGQGCQQSTDGVEVSNMEIQELHQLISKPEWADVELKKAANAFPREALSSVCAFANSGGGYLVLGVDEKSLPTISGIQDIDKVQNECLGLLKDTQKFSCRIDYDPPELLEIDGVRVLVIFIQDAGYQNKPVSVVEGKVPVVYLRKGARDEKATAEEISRMLIEANNLSATDRLLKVEAETFFNPNTLKWYRKVFESRHNLKYYDLSHLEFLDELGLVQDDNGQLKPTRAAVLMFGTDKLLRQQLSRCVVDAFWHNSTLDQSDEAERWADRRELECNLFDAWRQLAERFMYHAEQSFDIDETNLQRSHETPDYIGFRESAVNLLIHQDFTDHSRVPRIDFYKDASVYWNPGDSLVEQSKLGKGGSATRNPLIMQTFVRIGLSERAGSGLKAVFRNWRELERSEPEIINDVAAKTFQITLGRKPAVSELQTQLHSRIGVKLSNLQAQAFVHCLAQPVSVDGLAGELGASSEDTRKALNHLRLQGLVVENQGQYVAQAHFQTILANLTSDHAGGNKDSLVSTEVTKLTEALEERQREVLCHLQQAQTLKALMDFFGKTHRNNFKNNYLDGLVEYGLVALTHPGNPKHPDQAYELTELGQAVRQRLTDHAGS